MTAVLPANNGAVSTDSNDRIGDRPAASVPCTHRSSAWPDMDWLPLTNGTALQGLARHPHCIHCGTVKNISGDRTRGLGYYTSVLSRMKELKRVQVRLISKELKTYKGFDDSYAMTGTGQMRIFTEIVRKYSNIPEQAILRYL